MAQDGFELIINLQNRSILIRVMFKRRLVNSKTSPRCIFKQSVSCPVNIRQNKSYTGGRSRPSGRLNLSLLEKPTTLLRNLNYE